MTRQKGFRYFIASIVGIAAMLGVATEVLGDGGSDQEPGGNKPSGYNLSGPAIVGTIHMHGESEGDSPYTSTFDFEGTCKGKLIQMSRLVENKKSLAQFTRYCEGSTTECMNDGGYIESFSMPIDFAYDGSPSMYELLMNANCDDVINRNFNVASYILLYVQAVPAFRYAAATNELFADVVMLFLVPVE